MERDHEKIFFFFWEHILFYLTIVVMMEVISYIHIPWLTAKIQIQILKCFMIHFEG